MHGRVARLLAEREAGFVRATDGREYFFHRGGMPGVEYGSLTVGAPVEFEVGHDPGDAVGEAPRALRVRPSIDLALGDPSSGTATTPGTATME